VKPEIRQRRVAALLMVGLGGLLAALAAWLGYIQIASSDRLAARASDQQHTFVPIMPWRGNIFDARLRVLAGSVEAKSVFADPKEVDRPDVVALEVSRVLGLKRDEVYAKLTEGASRRHLRLAQGVSREQADKVIDLGIEGLAVARDGGSPTVWADAKVIKRLGETADRVSPILGLSRDETYQRLVEAAGPRFVWLDRRISPEKADAIRRMGLRGVGLVSEGVRHYPNGSLAAHVLGFVGDDEGLEGIERLFNDRLAGRKGHAKVLVDRARRPIWIESDEYAPAVDGQHLVLTIDAKIQSLTEEAIAEAQQKFRAVSVVGIVMDPATGAILACANVPTYDPGRYGEFAAEARRNRAVTDTFPPGSSCKPFVASVALEEGVVRLGEVIYCENGYWAEAKLHDAGHSYGNLMFEQGIEKSSNIMMAKLGVRLGNRRLHDGLINFGFGRRTGVWLPGESPGVVFPLSRWTKLSTTRVAFGQEFAVTPLQLISAFAAIANGGKVVRPKILRGILDRRGQSIVDLPEVEIVGQAVSARTCRQMIDRALVGVVEKGTGTRCKIPGYRVFGKTGTAQKIDPETKAVSHTRYMGSFLGGAPADKPRVVVLVVVDEPDKSLGYYGGTVAAPAVKRILEQTLPYLGVPTTETVAEETAAHLVQENRVTD
jgi:cell division protein FtsI (penicillin-binding protein 3)